MKLREEEKIMKRICNVVLSIVIIIVLVSAFPTSVFAEGGTQSYQYELAADGQTEKYVRTGDIITVTLYLNRTDSTDAYAMYAMQDEIRYDSSFFEYVEGSELLASGVRTTRLDVGGGYKEVYLNFLSFGGGEQWQARKPIGSFQLRVIAESGVSKITNQDYLVSLQDGSGSYPCEANELTIIISTECKVHFETNGGNEMSDITAIYGEKLTKPTEPQREGKIFAGWYKNIDCTEAWNFDSDTVSGNMTLYARWTDIPIIGDDTEPEPPETEAPETEAPETDPPETDPPETDPSKTDPPETDPSKTDDEPHDKDKDNNLWVLWLVLALLALTGLGVFLYFRFFKKPEEDTTPPPPSDEEECELSCDNVTADTAIVTRRVAPIKANVGNKFTVNIDQLSEHFNSGETVDINSLKARGLVPKNATAIKILGRGALDKKLIVKANDFSVEAEKMIELCGGSVIRI